MRRLSRSRLWTARFFYAAKAPPGWRGLARDFCRAEAATPKGRKERSIRQRKCVSSCASTTARPALALARIAKGPRPPPLPQGAALTRLERATRARASGLGLCVPLTLTLRQGLKPTGPRPLAGSGRSPKARPACGAALPGCPCLSRLPHRRLYSLPLPLLLFRRRPSRRPCGRRAAHARFRQETH